MQYLTIRNVFILAGAVAVASYFLLPFQGFVITAGLCAVAAGAAYLKLRNRDWHYIYRNLVGYGIGKHLAQFKHSYTTPKGARVWSTVQVPAEALTTVDEGLAEQIKWQFKKYPNWQNYRNVSDYDVLFIEPMGTNVETEPGSPHIKVNGISTAGTVVGMHWRTNIKKPYLVIPHQQEQNWRFKSYLFHSIWHEAEHACEKVNADFDPKNLYIHYMTAQDVHPHAAPDEVVGLKSTEEQHLCNAAVKMKNE
jgi:hypothetical protein